MRTWLFDCPWVEPNSGRKASFLGESLPAPNEPDDRKDPPPGGRPAPLSPDLLREDEDLKRFEETVKLRRGQHYHKEGISNDVEGDCNRATV